MPNRYQILGFSREWHACVQPMLLFQNVISRCVGDIVLSSTRTIHRSQAQVKYSEAVFGSAYLKISNPTEQKLHKIHYISSLIIPFLRTGQQKDQFLVMRIASFGHKHFVKIRQFHQFQQHRFHCCQ